MLDRQLNPLLIEANSNPCLDNTGIILGKLIYELLDNVLMTAVDPLFPTPKYSSTDTARVGSGSTSARTTSAATNSSYFTLTPPHSDSFILWLSNRK
jgi:hypothetical protein